MDTTIQVPYLRSLIPQKLTFFDILEKIISSQHFEIDRNIEGGPMIEAGRVLSRREEFGGVVCPETLRSDVYIVSVLSDAKAISGLKQLLGEPSHFVKSSDCANWHFLFRYDHASEETPVVFTLSYIYLLREAYKERRQELLKRMQAHVR